ncbi:MAG: hypothetical protein GY899_12400, partial [Verrucomicrobiaceae bacterium]|nr:hypothetical protein [Verrucomicrobiaceae bacterium]
VPDERDGTFIARFEFNDETPLSALPSTPELRNNWNITVGGKTAILESRDSNTQLTLTIKDNADDGSDITWGSHAAVVTFDPPEGETIIITSTNKYQKQKPWNLILAGNTDPEPTPEPSIQVRLAKEYFGDGSTTNRTLCGYFKEVSNGRLNIVPATGPGIVNGILRGNPAGDPFIKLNQQDFNAARGPGDWDKEYRRRALAKADASGVDFSRFDKDLNNVIDNHELIVVLVTADPAIGGAARSLNREKTHDGKTFLSNYWIGSFTDGVNLVTVLHEVAHHWDALDLYNPGGFNQNATLMGATVSSNQFFYHIDPWHAIRYGWQQPRIYSLADPIGGGVLRSPNNRLPGYQGHPLEERPIILYDPARGTDEYFILEYRKRINSEGSATTAQYDQNVGDQGLAIWYVRVNEDKNLITVPRLILDNDNGLQTPTNRDDNNLGAAISWGPNRLLDSIVRDGDEAKSLYLAAVYVAAPQGSENHQEGELGTVTAFWNGAHSNNSDGIQLKWFSQGTSFNDSDDAGINLFVESITNYTAADSMSVYWRKKGFNFPQNLDNPVITTAVNTVSGLESNPGVHRNSAVIFALKEKADPAISGGRELAWYRHNSRISDRNTSVSWKNEWSNYAREKIVARDVVEADDRRRQVYTSLSDAQTVVAAGKGVLYSVDSGGALRWYRHSDWQRGGSAQEDWTENSPALLTTGGWNQFKQVIPGGEGVLYGIKPNGSLVWYKHEGWLTGTPNWTSLSETVLSTGSGEGSGWAAFKHVIYGGAGVFYVVSQNGQLGWYRHLGWQNGNNNWVSQSEKVLLPGGTAGSGWAAFTQVHSASSGSLYCIKPDGSMVSYLHLGWQTGERRWKSNRERVVVPEPAGWNGFRSITFMPIEPSDISPEASNAEIASLAPEMEAFGLITRTAADAEIAQASSEAAESGRLLGQNNVIDNPENFNLLTAEQLKALAISPSINKVSDGKVSLNVRFRKTQDFKEFSELHLGQQAASLKLNEKGELVIEFASDDDTAYFQLIPK